MSGALLPIEALVLTLLERAANARQPVPSNYAIADRIGASSPSTPSHVLKKLEQHGLIRVERFQAGREITIVATGARTAFDGERTPHSHAGRRRAPAKIAEPRPAVAEPPARELATLVRVDRDPCFRCGTRRDLGCRHYPKES